MADQPTVPRYSYHGYRRDGIAVTGRADIADLARWVKVRWQRGFRSLVVFDGVGSGAPIVAQISRLQDRRRVWWAEDRHSGARAEGGDPDAAAGEQSGRAHG